MFKLLFRNSPEYLIILISCENKMFNFTVSLSLRKLSNSLLNCVEKI